MALVGIHRTQRYTHTRTQPHTQHRDYNDTKTHGHSLAKCAQAVRTLFMNLRLANASQNLLGTSPV